MIQSLVASTKSLGDLTMYVRTDRPLDGWTDGWTGRPMDGWTDGWRDRAMDGRTKNGWIDAIRCTAR